MVCHYPDKFGGQRHCDSSDIQLLLCHLTSREHVFKVSCRFMNGRPSGKVATLTYFVAIVLEQVEI